MQPLIHTIRIITDKLGKRVNVAVIPSLTVFCNKLGKFQYFNVVYSLCEILKYTAEIHMQNGNQKAAFIKYDSNTISKVLKYLHKNYTYDITVDDVVDKFKISKSTLYNIFVEYVGVSFKEYLIRLRITKSMELLRKGLSVTEAANLSGFNSYAHFIRTFTNRTGTSPKQFSLSKSSVASTDYLRYLNN